MGGRCDDYSLSEMAITWELQDVASKVQGIEDVQLAWQSKSIVQTEGPDGQLANLRPFVLDYKETLWGRDLVSQRGV